MTKISEYFLRITVVFAKIAATLFVPFMVCQIPGINIYPIIVTILSIGFFVSFGIFATIFLVYMLYLLWRL